MCVGDFLLCYRKIGGLITMQREKRKRTKSGIFFKCPECKKRFRVIGVKSHRQADNSTCDCFYCGALLLIVNGKARNFHREMHKDYPKWPRDGQGTGWIGI